MNSNDELVDYLVNRNIIRTGRVERAFRDTDRGDFVPEDLWEKAYLDTPLPLGFGATISAPHIVAEATQLLEVRPDSRVLEIGSGSGYQLAIISYLTDAEVIGVEIEPELVERSRKNLEGLENVEVVLGEGLEPVEGVFDRILYSCAIDSLLESREYLANGGIIVAPVRDEKGQRLKRLKNGVIETHARVRFVDYRDS